MATTRFFDIEANSSSAPEHPHEVNPAQEKGDLKPESAKIPALSGRDLLEAIYRKETGSDFGRTSPENETPSPSAAIPLVPELLSAPEIEALMRTDAYRTWYLPESERVRNAVGKWFEITYPGPLNVDSAGRMIRTEDRARPATAPHALSKFGPLSLQRAKRLAPLKPTNNLTASHQRYNQIIEDRMNAWYLRQQANAHFKRPAKNK